MAATVNPATGSNGLHGTDFRFKDGKAVNVLGQMHWAVKLKNMHVQKKRLLGMALGYFGYGTVPDVWVCHADLVKSWAFQFSCCMFHTSECLLFSGPCKSLISER